ncbi:hypothetical protein [Shinella sp. JR1-6]|nr:hypothetical protein [Shinella sp. JR1-6]
MVYEWDPARANRAEKIRLMTRLALTLLALVVPAAFVLATITT